MNDVNGYDSTIKYAIMDIVGAINKIESMKQDRYLAMHPYSITHSADTYCKKDFEFRAACFRRTKNHVLRNDR